MYNLIIQLLVLSSINSLSAGETLTAFHVNDALLHQPRTFPCPDEADIVPCVCNYDSDSSRLTLDCTNISSDEELANILAKEFPVTDFYEFKMENSSSLTTLNFTCGSVNFRRFYLYPGPFPSLVEVSDVFYYSCSNAELEYVQFRDTQLTSLVFPPTPLSDKITDFNMPYSYMESVPAISSDSLSNIDIGLADISQIVPGTFDEASNLSYIELYSNNIKVLESGSIPITRHGYKYAITHNGLETIEPGAFTMKGEPPLNSLKIYINNNFLKTFDASVYGLLMTYIYEINIEENPFDCGCDMAWIVLNPEYMAKVTIYGYPTCADGILLTDLDPTSYEDFC